MKCKLEALLGTQVLPSLHSIPHPFRKIPSRWFHCNAAELALGARVVRGCSSVGPRLVQTGGTRDSLEVLEKSRKQFQPS